MRVPGHKYRAQCAAAMDDVLKQALYMAGYKEPHVSNGWAACGKGKFGSERLSDNDHCSWSDCPGHGKRHREDCGWPLIWKVTKLVMAGQSCGNSSNSQFYYPKTCFLCNRIEATCRRCNREYGEVETAFEARNRKFSTGRLCGNCKGFVDTNW